MATNMDPSGEPISARCSKLSQIIAGKACCAGHRSLVNRDGLIDALLVLYEECNTDYMKKDKHIASFVDKFRGTVSELKRIRVHVGDFEVKKVIGRGHFGEVHVVREKQTGDVYAMKTLRKSEALSQQSIAFYEEERDIMAKANSEWITKLQYAFQDAHNLYMIMEFHPGGDLLSLMDRHDDVLPVEMVRFYMAEIILAIHALHTMGYVHRDIKPDNLILDRMGHIKLADFGSAAKLTQTATVTSEMPVGTQDYLAPEVLLSMNNCSTKRISTMYGLECDWWSLGIVGYEMLCGKTPFADEKVATTYSNIMNHKDSLHWPDDVEVTSDIKNAINGLLMAANDRLDYAGLRQHKAFTAIDWDNLRSTRPPFVPKVSGQDDTSNFEEFPKEDRRPLLDDFIKKREFSGKNLPFIGFTFTHNISSTRSDPLSRSASVSALTVAKMEEQLTAKRRENHELVQRVHDLERRETSLNEKMRTLEKRESFTKRVENDRKTLEVSLSSYAKDVAQLKRVLEMERKERVDNEKSALQMVADAKQKWQQERKELRSEVQSRKEFIEDIELQFLTAKSNELKFQKENGNLRRMLDESRNRVCELERKMTSENTNSSRRQSLLTEDRIQTEVDRIEKENENRLRELRDELERVRSSERTFREQSRRYENEARRAQEKLDRIESEHNFCSNQVELRENLEKTLDVQRAKCEVLERELKEKQVLIEKQMKEKEVIIADLRKKLDDEKDTSKQFMFQLQSLETSVSSSYHSFEEFQQLREQEHKDRMQELENDIRETATEKIHLLTELQSAEDREQERVARIQELQEVVERLEGRLGDLELAHNEGGGVGSSSGKVSSKN